MLQKPIGLSGIRIKKRRFPEWVTLFIFLFPLVMSLLLEFLKLPSVTKYTADVAWGLAFFSMGVFRRTERPAKYRWFVWLILSFLLYTFVVYIFHFQSAAYYLWGLRNNFRFYVAFLAFAMFFDEEEAMSCLNLLDGLFWVNAAVSAVQFFLLGYRQDYLGGLFGVEKGCNAYSAIFFSIVIAKSLLQFMNRKESMWYCFLKCGVTLVISAMAELKFFFILFVMILIMATLFTRFSWQKFAIILISAGLVSVGGSMLTVLFGEGSTISIERILELITAENYATAEDLGRFTAIPTLSREIMTDGWQRLFGLGLGNCDTSTFAVVNTPFYQSYAGLHYTWFSSAFLFLEVGAVGLVLYLVFFLTVFFAARRNKKTGASNELFCQIGMIMAPVCVVLTFYNSSLRMEVAYLAFFALALPFVGRDRRRSP